MPGYLKPHIQTILPGPQDPKYTPQQDPLGRRGSYGQNSHFNQVRFYKAALKPKSYELDLLAIHTLRLMIHFQMELTENMFSPSRKQITIMNISYIVINMADFPMLISKVMPITLTMRWHLQKNALNHFYPVGQLDLTFLLMCSELESSKSQQTQFAILFFISFTQQCKFHMRT